MPDGSRLVTADELEHQPQDHYRYGFLKVHLRDIFE
jgi:hypothetical protein